MKKFISKFQGCQPEVLSCFDRVLFKGHLPISHAEGMEQFLSSKGVLLKEFKRFVSKQAFCLKKFGLDLALRNGRPYIVLNGFSVRKEERAREIACKDKIKEGVVCVFSNVEGCNSFRIKYGEGGPYLKNARRKCLCLYFYIMDSVFGLIHIRIQTWFPFTVQICMNGHEYLERQLCNAKIGYTKEGNCFTEIEDFKKAQELSDDFHSLCWPEILSGLAEKVNPLLKGLLSGMKYYWVTEQAEYATDVVFGNLDDFEGLYEKFLNYAIQRFGSKDILTFLDKCCDGRFKGDQFNICRRRMPGARVRHWVKHNWIKMYNKKGRVVRIETVINHPYDFKIRRNGIRKGEKVYDWFPMSKWVNNLHRYAEISRTANGRYLDGLAAQEDSGPSTEDMKNLSASVEENGRRYGAFNPAKEDDVLLMAEIMRAEYLIRGFRNADIREVLFGKASNKKQRQRQATKVSRMFKKLHVRKMIAKIPHSHRWRVTDKGSRIMGTVLDWYNPLGKVA